MRNGTQTGANMPDYSKQQEMEAFDSLPAPIRDVLREAPFDVSAADMLANAAVASKIEELGDDAADWLQTALTETYRTKILASSQFSS